VFTRFRKVFIFSLGFFIDVWARFDEFDLFVVFCLFLVEGLYLSICSV